MRPTFKFGKTPCQDRPPSLFARLAGNDDKIHQAASLFGGTLACAMDQDQIPCDQGSFNPIIAQLLIQRDRR